jgi:cytochrome P450
LSRPGSSRRRRDLVARYQAGLTPHEEVPQDLITLLYLHWDEAWDAGLPLRETTLFLVGSTATTAQAFPHFIKHIESWMTEHPGDRHLIADDPRFLRQALFESLRLFVAAPARLRRSLREVVLKSGRKIAEGERVGLLFQPANADPGIFGDDAMTFNPRHSRAVGSKEAPPPTTIRYCRG